MEFHKHCYSEDIEYAQHLKRFFMSPLSQTHLSVPDTIDLFSVTID